jgi:excisionase family DNA binding protein
VTATRDRLARILGPDLLELLETYVAELVEAIVADRETGRPWLTVGEAAEYLGSTPAAIRKRIHRGAIPYVRHGRSLMVDRRALDVQLGNGRSL